MSSVSRTILAGLATLGSSLAIQVGLAHGAPQQSSQAPVVSTGQATGVMQGAATLTATIDTLGHETTYELDLGADTSYGSRIFGDAGTEPGSQTFTIPLQGLAPGTTYHYRVQATNAFGTSYGPDVTFTTAAYPSAVLVAPAVVTLIPAPLLATEPPSSKAAQGASAGLPSHAARQGKGGARKRAHGHRKGGRAAGAARVHGTDRGGDAR